MYKNEIVIEAWTMTWMSASMMKFFVRFLSIGLRDQASDRANWLAQPPRKNFEDRAALTITLVR
jgi:hypothetical protein